MTAPYKDEEEDKPLDPAVERVRQRLVRFVAINLGLLFLALMAVVVAIVYRANRGAEAPPTSISELPAPADGSVLEGRIVLPAGARVLGHSMAGARLGVLVELPGGGRQIVVYDMTENRVVGRFKIAEEE